MTDRKKKIIEEIERHRARISGQGIGQREWESLENLVAIARMASDLEDERDETRKLKERLVAVKSSVTSVLREINAE